MMDTKLGVGKWKVDIRSILAQFKGAQVRSPFRLYLYASNVLRLHACPLILYRVLMIMSEQHGCPAGKGAWQLAVLLMP